MIIWLNGPFGVGKTSTARAVVERLPGARIVDPERIGFVMRRTFWRGVDYQEVAVWRHLTLRAVERASRRGPVVVPMTVVEPDVFEEITAPARVFALVASPQTLEARIGGDRRAQRWRTQNLERCLKAFSTDAFGERVDTDGRTPAEVAHRVLSML